MAVNLVDLYKIYTSYCIDLFDGNIKENNKIIEKHSLILNAMFDQLNNKNNLTDIDNIKTTNQRKCNVCGAINKFSEDDKHCCIVCLECGCEQEELLENGPEWHQYNNDDGRGEGVNRCGSIVSHYFPKSSQGTIIVGFNNSRLNKKQKWDSTNHKENTLNEEFGIITKICSIAKIKKIVIDDAKYYYKKICDCKHKSGDNAGKQIIIRGPNRDGVICACVYKACENNRDPRSKKEVAKMYNKALIKKKGKENPKINSDPKNSKGKKKEKESIMTEKSLSRGIKEFEDILKNSDDADVLNNIHDGTPEDYIRKYSVDGNITQVHIDIAVRIANNCEKLKIATDHSAQSIGAGVTLLMTNCFRLGIDKRDVAYWFGISEVTITKIYNKIVPYAKILIDDGATEFIIKKFKVNG